MTTTTTAPKSNRIPRKFDRITVKMNIETSQDKPGDVLRRMIQAERKRINEVLLPLFKAYGFNKYGISARFSNGETWYSQIA